MPTPATRRDRPAGRPRIPAALAFQPGHSIGKNTLALSRRSVTAAFSPSGPIPRRIRASGSPRLLSGSNGSAEKRCRGETDRTPRPLGREVWSGRHGAMGVMGGRMMDLATECYRVTFSAYPVPTWLPGNGPGYGVLPSHEGISRGRTLRDDEPDSVVP